MSLDHVLVQTQDLDPGVVRTRSTGVETSGSRPLSGGEQHETRESSQKTHLKIGPRMPHATEISLFNVTCIQCVYIVRRTKLLL